MRYSEGAKFFLVALVAGFALSTILLVRVIKGESQKPDPPVLPQVKEKKEFNCEKSGMAASGKFVIKCIEETNTTQRQ